MPLRSFALHLRQAREAELVKARLKDAEDALAATQRSERERAEQAPPISFCFRTVSAARFCIRATADVAGACSSQCVLPVQVAALQLQLERQQVPVRPSRLHIT